MVSPQPHTLIDAEIISHSTCPGEQRILRIYAPEIARAAQPGCFIFVQVAAQMPMLQPIPILRTNPPSGHIDLLYRVYAESTKTLAARKAGEKIRLSTPIGQPFKFNPQRSRPLLIGDGLGIAPLIFMASEIARLKQHYQPFVILGCEAAFPFTASPSKFIVAGVPDGVIAAMPLLEDLNIPSRLASSQDDYGCYNGASSDLAQNWLNALEIEQHNEIEIYACGSHAMIERINKLAKEFGLPAQTRLDYYIDAAEPTASESTITHNDFDTSL